MERRRLSEMIATVGLLAFFLSGPATASAAGPSIAFEAGASMSYWRLGNSTEHVTSAGFSFAIMGRHLGLEADYFTAFRPGSSGLFVANAFVSTNTFAPVSVFVSAGIPVPLITIPLGAGLRVRVLPNLSLVGQTTIWIAYEGGFVFMLGAHYRF